MKEGDFARNVESGWLGQIVRIYNDPYQVTSDGPMLDCLMAEMKGVNDLCLVIAGGHPSDWLDDDDIQVHAISDLQFVRVFKKIVT